MPKLLVKQDQVVGESEVYLTARVPSKLRDILIAHVARDTHMHASEFIREAIREKLQQEAPDLYRLLVQGPQQSQTKEAGKPRQP